MAKTGRQNWRTAVATFRSYPPQAFSADDPIPMIAVSAIEETPQNPKLGKQKASDQPLHWFSLISKCAADLDTAMSALQWYQLRWRIEGFFHPVKKGIQSQRRYQEHSEDLCDYLADDSITSVRVREYALLAKMRPDAPAHKYIFGADLDI